MNKNRDHPISENCMLGAIKKIVEGISIEVEKLDKILDHLPDFCESAKISRKSLNFYSRNLCFLRIFESLESFGIIFEVL